jgi:hypothetical protein
MGQRQMDKPPTRAKPSATETEKPARRKGAEDLDFDARTMPTGDLLNVVLSRFRGDALATHDLDMYRLAAALERAANDPAAVAPKPRNPGSAIARGKASEAARAVFDTVETVLERLRDHDNVDVAVALLLVLTRKAQYFECHPDAPTWQRARNPNFDGDDMVSDSLWQATVAAIAAAIKPLRADPDDVDAKKITRAAFRALGMSDERVNNLFRDY